MALVEEVEGLPKVDVNIPLEDLDLEKKISKGGFGEVWKASYFGTDVAVKKMLRPDDSFLLRLIQREISALKEVRHPNICLFLGVCLNETQILLVTEYIDGGTLWKLLKNRGKSFPWSSRLHVAVELAKAMTFLHAKGIAHRDLKSDNVLMDKSLNPKICDFGLARGDMKDTATKFLTKAGTETWMAPEIILGDPYSLKADVFSFGVVLYELIVRDRPPDRSPMDAYQFQFDTFAKSFPMDTPSEIAAIAVSCVSSVPEERPAFKDVLNSLKELQTRMKEEAKAARPPKPITVLPPPLEVLPPPSNIPDAIIVLPPSGIAPVLMPPPPVAAAASWIPAPINPSVPPLPVDAMASVPLSPSYVDSTKLKKKKRRTATASDRDLPVPIGELVLPPALSSLPIVISPTMSPPPPLTNHTTSNPSSPRGMGTPPNLLTLPIPYSPSLPASPTLPPPSPILPPPEFSATFMMPPAPAGSGSDSGTPVKHRPKSPSRRSATPDPSDSISKNHPNGPLSSSTSKIKPRKTKTPSKRRLSVELEGQSLPPPLDSSSAELSDEAPISLAMALPPPPASILSPHKKLRSSAPTSTESRDGFLPPPMEASSRTRDPSPSKRRSKSRDKNDPTKSSKEAQ